MSERRCMPSKCHLRTLGIRFVRARCIDSRGTLRHDGEHATAIGLKLTVRIPLRAAVIHARIVHRSKPEITSPLCDDAG
jgi:hypothetical protein